MIYNPKSDAFSKPAPTKFDPSVHLSLTGELPKQTTFEELGLEGASPLSNIAITEPFHLFSKEGVRELRRELFSDQVQDHFLVSRKSSAIICREFPATAAPFIHAAWNSPEVLSAVSKAIGVDVVPCMELDVAHVNLNFPYTNEGRAAIKALPLDPAPGKPQANKAELEAASAANMGENAIVNWHNDAYPIVCVLMLSDTTNMIGGETAIKASLSVIGPSYGTAVAMQGRYVNHTALEAFSAGERITMVCSFRPKDPLLEDSTDIRKLHSITKANRMNGQVASYRMEIMAKRFAACAAEIQNKMAALPLDNDLDGEGGEEVVKAAEFSSWLKSQVDFLEHTRVQLMV
ncbi:hypothetical protein MNV49_001269 [Pseudohyphozyma bogoriensis]|nr:hypothetical protein MNV49_001269 [Pseudohyphozyma bogoriensis]